MNRLFSLLSAMLLFATQAWAQNPNEVTFGDYTVNYNAFPSTLLEPATAKAIGISRASYRGVVTIAVRKHQGGGKAMPVDASVNGHVTNLIGQRPALKFTRVNDGGSLYYISPFSIPRESNDKLTFNITVQPAGETRIQKIEFQRSY